MTFSTIQSELETARAEAFDLSRQLFREEQRLRQCRQEKTRLERFTKTSSRPFPGRNPRPTRLERKIEELTANVRRLSRDLTAAQAIEREHLTEFLPFSDPRDSLDNLSDEVPILLLPLRIETRFKPAAETDGLSDEVWVRVYPDDIAVDTFEDTLSETEALNAQAYWVNIWRAGGVEAEERGAWKILVGSHGSGRSHWITQNYRPLNEGPKPSKNEDNPAVILVIPTQQTLPDTQRALLFQFWEAFWRAGHDPEGQRAALRQLIDEIGAERAHELRERYVPENLADEPPQGLTRANVPVHVVMLDFPSDEAVAARETGWSQAPYVNVMPERLVLMGYRAGAKVLEILGNPIPSPLVVAPDPAAAEDDLLRPDGDDIQVSENMQWVVDFDKAVADGMGFKVPLDPSDFEQGFDQLVVLGVRLRSDKDVSQVALETLIDHHHHSRAGFAIVPQGRPTNNVEGAESDYSWREDADVSFNRYFIETNQDDPEGWFEKTDGRWLADCLGLDPAALSSIPHYHRNDIGQARAMNIALWPATLGYFMETMMQPVFDDETSLQTRSFFNRHVSARGTIPAIRVGDQPYGILPATPRSRMNWLLNPSNPPPFPSMLNPGEMPFLRQLYNLLLTVESDWDGLQDNVSHVGKTGRDAHQILLDVLGLHASSVEHDQRYAESFLHLFNRMRLQMAGQPFWLALLNLGYVQNGLDLLAELGVVYDGLFDVPDILAKLFLHKPNLLKGGLIDDHPLSETKSIRPYTESGRDYIEWLIRAARTSHNALRLQADFAANQPPTVLLYLMLHHALDLSFVETSLQLYLSAQLPPLATPEQVRAARREATFIHIQTTGASRWQYLYRTETAITLSDLIIGDFIPTILETRPETDYLNHQLTALQRLQGTPTAALERAFTEHLDLCTYRLDAWFNGLMSYQLSTMRGTELAGGGSTNKGIYLGAYGWLENVRPEFKVMTPVELEPELDVIFNRPEDPPLTRDQTNAGYIHAPSLNHAVTAAILRNGYLSNATPDNPDSLAINLSSERVRLALSMIEGMRAGQSLAALLGYQFERGLHDRHTVEVDAFIYDLRKAFPLSANRFANTRVGATDETGRRISIRQLEARNVIDGLSLVEHMKDTGNHEYPFGLEDLPDAELDQVAAITAEAERIANIADAVADLAMAESVHQVAQGNYDRAGATLETYSKGKFPALPDVVKTPRSGVTLTHRVGLHLESGLDPNDPVNTSPRAKAEPAINQWLARVLPSPETVACLVTVTDRVTDSEVTHVVSQADLGLTPIDLLYIADTDSQKAMRALDDAIEYYVIATQTPKPHADITIHYRAAIATIDDHVSFFDLAAAIRSLRALLLRSRPLRPSDMALMNEAREREDADVLFNIDRATLIRDELAGHLASLQVFQTALQSRIDEAQHGDIIDEIDVSIATFAHQIMNVSPFDYPEVGIGSIFDDKRRIFKSLLDKLSTMTDRWDEKLVEFDAAIANYAALSEDIDNARKFLDLQKAERLISTQRTTPLPATPDDFHDTLVTAVRAQFVSQLESLKSFYDTANTLSGLYNDIDAAKTTNALFDAVAIDLDEERGKILALAEDLASRTLSSITHGETKLAAANAKLAAHDAATQPQEKLDEAIAAVKVLLGEEFQLIPEFGLASELADEWSNAWGDGDTASRDILGYLENEQSVRFPMDDWLYGISRVREKMHHLENCMLLTEALTGEEIDLQPLQFPYHANDTWLGLDFPEQTNDGDDFAIDEDKLLYTAHYMAPFSKDARQCGLLLDEWTEVIPSKTEDTGLTFHYDRPNSEPPQVLLLALPSQFEGAWQWQDLVDTVHETMDLAKKRAIEPEHIDQTTYAKFLPATIAPITMFPITPSLNFAFNNNLASTLAADEGN